MISVQQLYAFANQAKRLSVYKDERFPPSLYYRFFELLVCELKPSLSVELGTCGGGASLYMALGWPCGRVVTIDISNDYPDNLDHIWSVCQNWEFWQIDSIRAAQYFQERSIGLLFIDTVHTYEQTLMEWEAYSMRLTTDAVVVLDDLYRDGMQRVWDELPGIKVRLDWLHTSGSPTDGGFGVVLL